MIIEIIEARGVGFWVNGETYKSPNNRGWIVGGGEGGLGHTLHRYPQDALSGETPDRAGASGLGSVPGLPFGDLMIYSYEIQLQSNPHAPGDSWFGSDGSEYNGSPSSLVLETNKGKIALKVVMHGNCPNGFDYAPGHEPSKQEPTTYGPEEIARMIDSEGYDELPDEDEFFSEMTITMVSGEERYVDETEYYIRAET